MTDPSMTAACTAGPELDDEPLLVRPYVRLLADQLAADEPVDDVPAPDDRPEDDGRHAGPPTDVLPTQAARPVRRVRWRRLAVGSGMLVLALGATALGLSLGDRPAAPAASPGGTAAPRGGLFGTAAAPALPAPGTEAASPGASDVPGTAGASSVPGKPPLPGVSPAPADAVLPSGDPAPSDLPAASPPPGVESRTGRITGASGLCLDGSADPDDGGDKVRRSDCNGAAGQAWTVAGDGTIRALGRCLQASGDQLRLRGCDGGAAQRWRSGPAGSLINQASGLCLGSPDNVSSRAPQRMAACNQSDAQRWTLP
ncbi:ricin-type beta-trefoil lectin domain protein [Dactylosporangium sp. NPDC049742]|uniref:ricin-type beta-trefoil lectin domain protein n=1 Tax=Dactylosporangium sp. NPDC049742 TaxID=3154737 RepID=UPI00344A7104